MRAFKPEGWPTVIPRIFTNDPEGVVAFMRDVFGATGEVPAERPAEIWIGESMLLVSDGGGLRDPAPAFLYVYVPDADAAYKRAVALRAETIEAPEDMPWGDRRATVRDPYGNVWQMATRTR